MQHPPILASSLIYLNVKLAHETEGRRLNSRLIGPGVAALLDDSSKGRYWIATIDGEMPAENERTRLHRDGISFFRTPGR